MELKDVVEAIQAIDESIRALNDDTQESLRKMAVIGDRLEQTIYQVKTS